MQVPSDDGPGFADQLLEAVCDAGPYVPPTAEDSAWYSDQDRTGGWSDADESDDERDRQVFTRSALDVFLDEIPPDEWDRQRRDHFDQHGDPLW